jgi:hypothetical protein
MDLQLVLNLVCVVVSVATMTYISIRLMRETSTIVTRMTSQIATTMAETIAIAVKDAATAVAYPTPPPRDEVTDGPAADFFDDGFTHFMDQARAGGYDPSDVLIGERDEWDERAGGVVVPPGFDPLSQLAGASPVMRAAAPYIRPPGTAPADPRTAPTGAPTAPLADRLPHDPTGPNLIGEDL